MQQISKTVISTGCNSLDALMPAIRAVAIIVKQMGGVSVTVRTSSMVSETSASVFSQWLMSFSKTAKKRLAFMVDRVTVLSSKAANTSSVLRSL